MVEYPQIFAEHVGSNKINTSKVDLTERVSSDSAGILDDPSFTRESFNEGCQMCADCYNQILCEMGVWFAVPLQPRKKPIM